MSHEVEKEDISLVESDVYITLGQCNVFLFPSCNFFRKWKTGSVCTGCRWLPTSFPGLLTFFDLREGGEEA